jgi:SAM-dependent methyltransferase
MNTYHQVVKRCLDIGLAVASAVPAAKRVFPPGVRRWLWSQKGNLRVSPPLGSLKLGHLRRVTPVSRVFGYDRGLPIDRYYIERFLSANKADIRGGVLEVAENKYASMFGGDDISQTDVLHVSADNPNASIVADLSADNDIPSNRFDCLIITQTLQFIYELKPAILTLHRILKPGGVLLATVPGISQISRYDMERWGDHWRFTSLSARKMLEEVFSPADIRVESYGNVLASNALLQGLAVEELTGEELDYHDRDYELLIAVRAVKSRDDSECLPDETIAMDADR